MSDRRISQLPEEVNVRPEAMIPIVQDGNNARMSVGGLSRSLTDVDAKSIAQTSKQTITTNAAIDNSVAVVELDIGPSSTVGVLLDGLGAREGQEKLIVGFNVSSTATISCVAGAGFTSITFNLTGQTCLLRFVHGMWFVVAAWGCTVG